MCVGWFVGVFCLFLFFTPVWWSHQQTSNKDMPTMFTIQYSHSHTLPTAGRGGELPLMRRRSHHLEISSATVSEEKRELKIK